MEDYVSPLSVFNGDLDNQSLSDAKKLIDSLSQAEKVEIADYLAGQIQRSDLDYLLQLPIENLSPDEKQIILDAWKPSISAPLPNEEQTPRERLIQLRAEEVRESICDEYAREHYRVEPD
ncbi:hypothetical protein [Roseibium sp. Sym1]|uniref:hypothetical protein n=1 Tax=Roseibium sp. Sym1 TaxID=3016006 RepID=UPI0022B2BF15|nr:hypothetical protein [Roseibium sp. Sym1]